MKLKIYFFILIWTCNTSIRSAAQIVAGNDTYFDPDSDAIAKIIQGNFYFLIPEETLVRSVSTHLKGVGSIERIDRYKHNDDWYMTINCRDANDIEQSVLIGLLLRSDGDGNYYAGKFWFACHGKGCGSCLDYNMERCFCMFDKPGEPGTPGYCSRTESDDPLLGKVSIQEK